MVSQTQWSTFTAQISPVFRTWLWYNSSRYASQCSWYSGLCQEVWPQLKFHGLWQAFLLYWPSLDSSIIGLLGINYHFPIGQWLERSVVFARIKHPHSRQRLRFMSNWGHFEHISSLLSLSPLSTNRRRAKSLAALAKFTPVSIEIGTPPRDFGLALPNFTPFWHRIGE